MRYLEQVRGSPATLKIATRLPGSGEIDARAGGELVEARGLAIVLRKAATALFPKDPEIELSVSVALVGGEFVEAHGRVGSRRGAGFE